jgi:aryl-alcohol dehydrogenase-like predicted oxidoreductase
MKRNLVTVSTAAKHIDQSENKPHTRVQLGRSGIEVSPVSVGTWQWGGRFYWGYGRAYNDDDLAAAFTACIESGINWFDTAELYSRGRSEELLGRSVNGAEVSAKVDAKMDDGSQSPKPLIATKFFPYPWRVHRSSFRRALKANLRRLNTDSIDLYQTHFPYRPRSFKYWVDALADAAQDGLIKAVGVSNYSGEQTKRAHEILDRRGLVLASNQIGYSLLNRRPESSGVLAACRELGVSVISFGPLFEGLLTGKYGPGSPPMLLRRVRWASKRVGPIAPLLSLMGDIAGGHDASHSQVTLRWLVQKGTLPIPGVKSAVQAIDNASAMKWELNNDEVAALDEMTVRYV